MTTELNSQSPQQKPPTWVIELVDESNNLNEIIHIVNKQFPGWIIHVSNGYHNKYNWLNKNWDNIDEPNKEQGLIYEANTHVSNLKNIKQSGTKKSNKNTNNITNRY